MKAAKVGHRAVAPPSRVLELMVQHFHLEMIEPDFGGAGIGIWVRALA